MARPMTVPATNPTAASRNVNSAPSRVRRPIVVPPALGALPNSARMSSTGGMFLSSLRGRNEPTTHQSRCVSSIAWPNAL